MSHFFRLVDDAQAVQKKVKRVLSIGARPRVKATKRKCLIYIAVWSMDLMSLKAVWWQKAASWPHLIRVSLVFVVMKFAKQLNHFRYGYIRQCQLVIASISCFSVSETCFVWKAGKVQYWRITWWRKKRAYMLRETQMFRCRDTPGNM